MEWMKNPGAWIKGARGRLGWTQYQLSEALGVRGLTISRWECGVCRPGRPVLAAIQAILEREGKSDV